MDLHQLEQFALADDRQKALEQFVPGTDDYYFHLCLVHEQAGELSAVEQTLTTWIDRHGHTAQVQQIRNRLALLQFDEQPDQSIEHLTYTLGLRFEHQRVVEGQRAQYPSRLDEALVSREQVREEGLRRSGPGDLSGFRDAAMRWLSYEGLSIEQLRALLGRLKRPDHPALVEMMIAELDDRYSKGFGALGIHNRLTTAQLERLAAERPTMRGMDAYVQSILLRMAPGPEVDWEHDVAEHRAYLDRMGSFVETLAPKFNPLRAHILYHRLDLERRHGRYDRDLLLTYLALPRQVSYANPDYLERFIGRDDRPFVLGRDYRALTGHPSVGSDEALVRDYLEHLWRDDPNIAEFEPLLRRTFIQEVLATTMLLAGQGDLEELTSMLGDPAAFARLKERVELGFAPQNPQWFSAEDSVTVQIDVKNVETLLCKVFEINTLSYFLARGTEVDTSIDLDGLVASEEHVFEYDEPPLRRVRRTLELSGLSRPGVYVVELIGGGLSSRALIRKGRLRLLERVGAAGHVFTILDENAEPVPDASLWFEGREYRPGDNGAHTIHVPFSTRPGRKSVLLRHGDVTTVEVFDHQAERYRLQAGIYVDRESLLAGAEATVIVRPRLTVAGVAASLTLIEKPTLVVRSTDLDGVESRMEIPQFDLHGDRESVHTFKVPERVRSLVVSLHGEVKNLSRGDTVELSDQRSFELNGIDREDAVEDVHLSRTADGVVAYLFGRSGEPKAASVLTVRLEHRDLRDPLDVVLQTDAAGRVELGALPGVIAVEVLTAAGRQRRWPLTADAVDWTRAIHGREGETIRVPYMARAPLHATVSDAEPAEPSAEQLREDISIIECRGSVYAVDRFESVRVRDGFIELHGLPAGNYELHLWRDNVTITVRLGAGQPRGAWIAGPRRQLERRGPPPLQIQAVRVEEEALAVQLGFAGRGTRVHVFGTRFVPGYAPFSTDRRGPRVVHLSRAPSHYVSGRDIGDEYRYILERRRSTARAGTMLARPGLLLAPWAVRGTETSAQEAAEGAAYSASAAPKPRAAPAPLRAQGLSAGHGGGGQANLDFLARPAAALVNLTPDEHGVVRIPHAAIEHASQLRVLAVDAHQTVCRTVVCTEATTPHKDQRLRLGLDPDTHYTEQKQVTVRESEKPLVVDDITTAKVEVYDTLASVYRFFATLDHGGTLSRFSMILRWPSAGQDERRAFYSEFCCHELNLFLSRKDPEFFAQVIEPHLRNKKHKTFIDHYLLGDDLDGYLRPWAYGRLNIVERILLAHRVEGERDGCARHVGDLDDLSPADLETSSRLFSAAIQGSALSADDPLGLNAAAEQRKEAMLSMSSLAAAPMVGGGAPGGAPGMAAQSRGRAMRGGASLKRKKKASRSRDEFDALELADDEDFDGDAELLIDDDLALDEFSSDGFGGGGEADLAARERQQHLFVALDTTKEWAENNYFERPLSEQGPELVTVSPFWRDFAEHRHQGPFLSANVHHAGRNFTEMMCALAVLDLPFEAEAPEVVFDGPTMTLRGGSRSVVFHEQIRPCPGAAEASSVLVAQYILRHDDRHRYEGSQVLDKIVSGELLVGVVYACKVVLTNPTSAIEKLDVLLQIPVGALPVGGGQKTSGQAIELSPQGTQTLEYRFYFPAAGTFAHFPVHVSREGALIASAPARSLSVVTEPSEVDRQSWPWVSQNGTDDEVLAWMDANNLARASVDPVEGLEHCAWRMKERGFYDRCLALLTRRHVYSRVLWSYSLHHRDPANIHEFLLHETTFLDQCGMSLRSPLLHVDAALRGRYEHLEYAPLVNARAHRLGARLEILNDRFKEQYTRLMEVLRQMPALGPDDELAVAAYLLLQDRIDEGLAWLDRVDPSAVQTTLQHDYLMVYAHFLREQPEPARAIAERYRDYPVDRWRHRFADALAQIDELSGQAPEVTDPDDRDQKQTTLAASEPDLELSVEQGTVTVTYRNLKAATIRYYRMDVELLFSRQPFVQQQSEQFSFVRPNLHRAIELPADSERWSSPLPEALAGANVIVEVSSGALRQSVAYFAHALSVQLSEGYGQLRVTRRGEGIPLPRTYVKVYARMRQGGVKFYKDGYTDLRGRFDYASLSTDDLDSVERFALLVLSDEHGALVREAAPPAR